MPQQAEEKNRPVVRQTATGSQQALEPNISRRSYSGLNAANFFLAEITGVVMPFLGSYFKGRDWTEEAIGNAIAIAGLGVFLMQTPAGLIVDRVRQRRTLLAVTSLLLGLCYGLVPVVPAKTGWVDPLLFVAGTAQAFFLPLLGALATAWSATLPSTARWAATSHGIMPATWPRRCWRWVSSACLASRRCSSRSP